MGKTAGMRDVAEQIPAILSAFASGTVAIARVVSMRGFGSRRAGEALVLVDGALAAGTLLGGTATASIVEAARASLDDGTGAMLIEVSIGDPEAVAAGLACGGSAKVFVQDARKIPHTVWESVAARRPVAVVTSLADPTGHSLAVGFGAFDGGRSAEPIVAGTLGDPGLDAFAVHRAAEAIRLRKEGPHIVENGPLLIEALIPVPHLVVLGIADLAGALRRQGELLGWTVEVADEREPGVTESVVASLGRIGPHDAVVVLSHDIPASCAVLAEGLRTGCYVGALGSRHTQSARAEHLAAQGVPDTDRARIHGPVGLDIGSRSPQETAVAIVAEILADRSGRTAGSLRLSAGPING